jgi:HEAT repeat protein
VAYAGRAAAPGDLSKLVESMATRSPDAGLDLLRALSRRLGELGAIADTRVTALLAGAPALGTRYLLVDLVARLAAAGDAEAQGRVADLALHDPAREVRTRATELLAAARDPLAVAAKALEDPEPRVREAALRAIGALHQGERTPAIVDLLGHDPWTFVRVAAADALRALPASPAADHALSDALGQLSPRVREHATLALGDRNATAYAGAVRDHLTDVKEDPVVRAASAHALGLLCDAKAVDALSRMAVDGGSSPDAGAVGLGLVATSALGTLHPADLASRFAPLRAKGVRPDARAAAERALAQPLHCPLPRPQG